jgi:putative lipoprotein
MSMAGSDGLITGTALYRERMALPADAVLEVVLEDISRADAMAEELGVVRLEGLSSPPFEFQILFDPSRIREDRVYSVRARITSGEKLLFTTDQIYPVLTRGGGNEVEMLLIRISGDAGSAASGAASGVDGLEDTHWMLIELAGEAVAAGDNQRNPHFVLRSEDHRLAGSGGCNRLMGSYELEGGQLRFGQMAMTRMACLQGMEIEAAFASALGEVRAWQMDSDALELLDGYGEVLMRFEARVLD